MSDISDQQPRTGFWGGLARRWPAAQKFLLEPHAKHEDDRRREYILNVILLGSIAVLSVMEGLMVWYTVHPGGHGAAGLSLGAFSFFPIFFVGLYVLARRGFVRFVSYAFVFVLFAVNIYAVYRWGVDVPMAVAVHALIIVIASVLIGSRFGFLMTGLVGMVVLALWYVQNAGIVLTDEEVFTAGDAVALSLTYGVIMVVAALSNREIGQSLSRARQSERALREERDLLEVKVEERTRDLQKAQFEKVENVHRLAEFGELASGLFHDLVNIVTSVLPRADVGSAPGLSPGSISSSDDVEALTGRVKDFTEGMRRQLHDKAIPELFFVDDAVMNAVRLLSYEAHRENVQITFNGASGLRIFGDPFRFHHIVTNLISNAIESYRAVSGVRERKVWISIHGDGQGVSLTVRDNGCGISDDAQKKIFEPFFTMKTGESGLGIGLAVVKRIVERDFHGTIVVASAVGQGSTFTVVVPDSGIHGTGKA